ncbi:mechanosensitive ion channel family protein [Cuspidothrix issatschenkoi LEGE 03284]|uniref:mechanosensitive ion channel family protein n=1 Tax=Cuspidothrix issatschenkoi TaxID=230752 RepID=UPI00187E760F|nr:mechanosensitive ion channel family protein [Cuspidothrix issatschenkoi]MBE9234346.1 mechanosensitive ion channel family protein [Cuspidothrix issatschenkoi LEGE 03284]
MNLLIILAEVGILIIFFLLLRWLVGNSFKLLIKLSILKSDDLRIKILRRNITGLLLLVCILLCIFIVGANGYLIYRGENLQQFTMDLIRKIPSGFWMGLGIGIAQSIGIVIPAVITLKFIKHWLKIASNRAKNLDQNTADDASIDAFFTALNQRIREGIWLWVLIACTQFIKLPKVVPEYLYIALRIYLIIGVGLLILKALAAIVDTLDVLSVRYSSPDNLLRFYDRLQHLIPFLKRCLEFVIYVCTVTLVIQQVQLIANLATFGLKIIKIIAIIFMSRVMFEVIYLLLEEVLFKNQNLSEIQKSRRLTIIPLFRSLLQYLIYFSVAVSILYVLDINPAPILAGAGIVGIAVGLGAQTLINDIVCGFFILFENYYLVGDYIEAGKAEDKTVEGTVEAIELRTTRIRHLNGQLHIIRNGDIGSITNYSKEYIFAVVEVYVPYNSNLTHIYQVIEEIGQQLKTNHPDVLEPTLVDSVESMGESNLLLRTLTKVKPGKHVQIQRILRKMFMDTLLTEGILLPASNESKED